jgi:hypothetical protein
MKKEYKKSEEYKNQEKESGRLRKWRRDLRELDAKMMGAASSQGRRGDEGVQAATMDEPAQSTLVVGNDLSGVDWSIAE